MIDLDRELNAALRRIAGQQKNDSPRLRMKKNNDPPTYARKTNKRESPPSIVVYAGVPGTSSVRVSSTFVFFPLLLLALSPLTPAATSDWRVIRIVVISPTTTRSRLV